MEKNTEIKLERKLNPLNVWSLALGSIIGWGAFVMPGTTFLPKAGTLGTAIGLSIGALIMITIALNYGYMIQKYPVAGGEYTFTQNTFGRRHAYICGWFLGLSYLSIVPLNATALGLVSRKLLGGLLEVGYLYSVAGWDIYAGEIALASFALILFALLSIKGISVAGWLQTVMALSLVASVFILFIGAFLSPQVEISNLQPLFPEGKSSWSAVIAVVAIAPWAFVGFDSIPQAAEEFNFSPKKANGIMIIAIVFGAFVYIAVNTVTAAVEPWQEFLARGYDWPTGEAAEIVMGKAGLLFL
ncbi:MAG: APC family permease, partial [Anaerovoracaceae bacterium]